MKSLTLENCNEKYLGWLCDPEVNRYLESRWTVQTKDTIHTFVSEMIDSKDNYLFGIFFRENDEHIGNIKIGSIDHHYNYAVVGFLIGEKSYWRRGLSTEAIKLITHFGFDYLGLNKIIAGAHGRNVGSCKALLKAGYTLEGIQRGQLQTVEFTDDRKYFGILKSDREDDRR